MVYGFHTSCRSDGVHQTVPPVQQPPLLPPQDGLRFRQVLDHTHRLHTHKPRSHTNVIFTSARIGSAADLLQRGALGHARLAASHLPPQSVKQLLYLRPVKSRHHVVIQPLQTTRRKRQRSHPPRHWQPSRWVTMTTGRIADLKPTLLSKDL